MSFFRRLSQFFTSNDRPQQIPQSVLMRELIDKARRAQYAEQYDQALDLLTQAYEIAEKMRDERTMIDINLSRGDILIASGDYATAQFVLTELKDDSEARQLNAPLAYSLCSLGVLEQQQGHLQAAQRLFEKAREKANEINTDGASGRAAAHLGNVYLEQGNASYAAYLLDEAVIKLDRSGDRELLGYFFGQLGLAQIQSGQSDQGEVRLQRGLNLAKSIQHIPQMRYLNTLVAENALAQGDYSRAKSYFEDAHSLYSDDDQQSEAYVSLLCHMSHVALKLGDATMAQTYAEQALAIAESLDHQKLVAKAQALIGLAKGAQPDQDALPYLEIAAKTYSHLEADSFTIDILRNLAAAQLKVGQTENALTTYQQAITSAKSLPADAASAYSDLANYYARERQLRDAIDAWQSAIRLMKDVNQSARIAGVHCDIALMYDQLGDGRMAKREFGTALEMLGRIDNQQMRGIILGNVAAAYSSYGDIESAEDFFKESLEIAKKLRDTAAELKRQGNYGRLLALTNRPQEALTLLMNAHNKIKPVALSLQGGIIKGNMALAYAALGDIDKASEHFKSAISQLAVVDTQQWQARVYANYGNAVYESGHFDEALSHYQTAYDLAQDASLVDVLIQVVIGQALIAIQRDQLDDAQTNLSKITPIAIRQDYQQLLAWLYQAWSQLYAKQGNIEEATDSWQKAEQIRSIMQMKPIMPDWL
ncbi:MAG: tetratricopeptide repeat protein [Phototrophicaceae bacterium]